MVYAQRERKLGSPAVVAAVSAALAVAAAANAQNAGGLETIIVTATRRAERLQDVSESISAFDSNAIAMRGLQQLDDYVKYVPGLSYATREPGGTSLVFRGVAQSGLQFGAVSSSGLYLDEQPITQSGRSPDPRLIDIERLEALRGPQGTLYGASSQSGTLRVITNKPNPDEFDAWVEGQVTNVEDGGTGYDVSAMVNIPLVADRLALRLVGFTAEEAGYLDNVLRDSPGVRSGDPRITAAPFDNSDQVEEDINSTTTTGGRAALRWDITDDVDLTLGALFQDVSGDAHGDVNHGVGELEQVRFEDESLDDEWYQLAVTLNASLSFGDAVVSASYFNRDFRYEADTTDYDFRFNQNWLDNGGYYVVYDYGGDPRGFATNHEKAEITTFEARLQSPGDSESRWSWLIGAFYSEDKGETAFDAHIRGYAETGSFAFFAYYEACCLTGNALPPTDTIFLGRYDTELDQKAVFGEVTFDVTDRFSITAGGRWFDYDRKFAQIQRQPEGFTGATALQGDQESSEDGTVSKLNLTYRFDRDRLVYATYSEGFRVGGSNPLKPASILPQDYSSDELSNYEIGAKSEWLDNRVRFNIAAYYMEWKDFAVQIEDPQAAVFQLGFVNLPSAEIPGVEADFAVTFSEQWQLDGAFAWNDAEVSEATTFSLVDDAGNVYETQVEKGVRLPLTPDWSATLGIEYRSSARWLEAQPFARFDYAYVGDSLNSLEGIESVVSSNPTETQEAYQTGDLRFGFDADNWSASIFVDNVWNEYAELFINNRYGNADGVGGWAGGQRVSILRPRTIGIQLRFDF